MDNVGLLREAIKAKKQVVATYQGRSREFCPHVLGTTKGDWVCLAYQFAGESSRRLVDGSDANWRCFKVNELFDIALRVGQWYTCPPRTQKPQRCVDLIELDVR